MAKRPTKRNASRPVSVSAPHGESETLRIRQISNGYLICRSGTKRGKYFDHEEFSPSKPVITASAPAKPERKA